MMREKIGRNTNATIRHSSRGNVAQPFSFYAQPKNDRQTILPTWALTFGEYAEVSFRLTQVQHTFAVVAKVRWIHGHPVGSAKGIW